MNKLTLIAALIGVSATSLFATTDYAFLNNVGTGVQDANSEYVSPYGGGLSTDTVETDGILVPLFCDDLNDSSNLGSKWQVNLTSVAAGDALLAANTRFGSSASSATAFNYNFGTATTLYEEVAWLFTQDSAQGANLADIQDAVWTLTMPSSGSARTPPTSSAITAWINDAQTYYKADQTALPNNFIGATYSNWAVVTDVNAVGSITGNGNQEFLTYIPAGAGPNGPNPVTPEPATFLLFGTGLLAAGLYGRRRKQTNS